MSYVEDTTFTLSGIGKDNIYRYLELLGGFGGCPWQVVWGWFGE
jgi:hypothetical protein